MEWPTQFGQTHDQSTGLMYYNARYYDPAVGRFISADTIVPNPADPQNLNRYAYVTNNPVRYADPSGHCTTSNGTLIDGVDDRLCSPKTLFTTNTDDGGRHVAVFGYDLDAATHVVGFLPGADTDLENLGMTYERANAIMHAANEMAGDDVKVAVVVLLVYDTPPSGDWLLWHMTTAKDKAKDAGDSIARVGQWGPWFGVGQEDDVTLIGHSFGAAAGGYGLVDTDLSDVVDKFVTLGTTGGPESIPGVPTYVLQNKGDPVPTYWNTTGVGVPSNGLAVDTGSNHGHSDYFSGDGLAQIARIILNKELQ